LELVAGRAHDRTQNAGDCQWGMMQIHTSQFNVFRTRSFLGGSHAGNPIDLLLLEIFWKLVHQPLQNGCQGL
jgi:hypothetical protein